MAAVCTAGLSVLSLWWVPPTVVLSFLAGRLPSRARLAALALLALVAAGMIAVSVVPSWLSMGSRFVAMLVVAAMLPWFAGRFWRQYRALVRAGWERAEHLEREQRLVADQARLRERARIAQDMHDLLGHDLSLIALSAGALKLAPDLPAGHREAAAEIRARAGAAVDHLGEVIGILSADGREDPMATDVQGLVAGASAAGLPVALSTEGEPPVVSPVAERAVHRVVQEALTNVAKHAPGAPVTVRIVYRDAETEVRVENEPAPGGIPAATNAGGGRGLVGLDERVRVVGGSLEYGPRGRGFAVIARIPHAPGAAPRLAATTERKKDSVPLEHRRARRRLDRTMLAAVAVPLAAVVLLGAGLRAWDLMLVRATVLSPDDYARIHVGQDRAEFTGILPERQKPEHSDEPSPGPGVQCEYYAMTANPFDDRSGDAYRLCFRAGRLVSKQVNAQ
ncbi:sensor histidine kinase [Actinomadura rubrisoli]|nr:histidine kinase [Actinomadura rubrisoli]